MDSVTIALHQLNRAIDLYFNERDFICTITLSNSAQTILRKNWFLNLRQERVKMLFLINLLLLFSKTQRQSLAFLFTR